MMNSLFALPLYRQAVIVSLLLLTCVAGSVSQTTSEWLITWKSASNNTADFPRGLVTAGPGNYVLVTERNVFLTTDAGVTWGSIADNGGSFTGGFTDVAYPLPGKVIVLADSNYYEGTSYLRQSRMMVTSDGGATWLEHRFSERTLLRDVSMADAMTGLVARQVLLAGAVDSLLLTTDGGITWQASPLPEGTRYPSQVICLSRESWGLVAYDTTGKMYSLYRTTNGGAEWVRSTGLPDGWGTIRFIDEQLAWTVGGAGTGLGHTRRDLIARSTDGGMTWTTVLDTLLDFRFGLGDIAFADMNNGIAVGGYGKMYRTTDGGTTWRQEWPPSDLIAEYINLRGVAYPAVDEAIAIGSDFYSIAYRGRSTLAAPRITLPNTNLADHPVQVTIEWTPIEGATSYDVQIGDTAYEHNIVAHNIFDVPYIERTGVTETSLTVTLQPHTRYAIRVRARNQTQVSDWSVRLNLLTLGEGKVLPSPTFILPTNGAQNVPLEVELKWTEIESAIGYDLRVALEPTYLVTHADEENLPMTSYLLKDLQPNTTYYARVRARDADGITSAWSNLNSGPLVFTTGAVASAGGTPGLRFAAIVQPNITDDRAVVRIDLAEIEDVEVRVVDMNGVEVVQLPVRQLAPGPHSLPLDLSTLPAGRYLVLITAAGVRYDLPLTVVR